MLLFTHQHITASTQAFPHLSKGGAFDQNHLYTVADVANVVGYAKERGIRVVPEFDVPGHTFPSWDRVAVLHGNSTLLTKCSAYDSVGGCGCSFFCV
jgi:hexosaminidase